jgi:hypothetical protein
MAYLAGQEITTADGRTGRLTGYEDRRGNPYYVEPGSGALYTARREEIAGPVAHIFGSTREAYDHSQTSDAIRDGDVLFVPTEGIAGVLYGAWPVAVNEPHDVQHGEFHGYRGGPDALAAADDGRYADSVGMARDLITRPAGRDLAAAEPAIEPADVATVTAAIGEINERVGYPATYAEPCPGHMVPSYAAVNGITWAGDSRDGELRAQIAGVEVGLVRTPDSAIGGPPRGWELGWWSAICLLPHQPGGDLRLFGCANPGSAINGLQHHLLTKHHDHRKPTPAAAAELDYPASTPLPGHADQGRLPGRPVTQSRPPPRPSRPGRSALPAR